jgi:hypothetical protein
MRKLLLAGAMVAMLGVGICIGSLGTPKGHAAQMPAAKNIDEMSLSSGGGPGGGPGFNQGYQPSNYGNPYGLWYIQRWQILPVPSPDGRTSLTLLVDTQTGESYYLAAGGNRYYWSHVTR